MRNEREQSGAGQERPGRRQIMAWLIGGGVGLVLVGARMLVPTSAAGAGRREKRPTLDPARFVGKARVAHEVARESPDLLDQLYCYCECDKSIGHKSLLSCYTDGHAAT